MTDPVNKTIGRMRTGEYNLLDMNELNRTRDEAQRLGSSGRISTASFNAGAYQHEVKIKEIVQSQSMKDRGTWFEYHDVPPAYRSLSAEGIRIYDDIVEKVLDALDPEKVLRREAKLDTRLVALLSLPVQHETGILFKRADVSLIEVDAITALNEPLGKVIQAMKKEAEPPRTNDYLLKLRDAFLDGKGGNGKTTEDVDKVETKKPNPFESDDAIRSEKLLRMATLYSGPGHEAYVMLSGSGALKKVPKAEDKASGPEGGADSGVSAPRSDEDRTGPLAIKFRSIMPYVGGRLMLGLEPLATPMVQFAGIPAVKGVGSI